MPLCNISELSYTTLETSYIPQVGSEIIRVMRLRMSMEDPFETIPEAPSPVPEIPIAALSESRPKRYRTAKIWYILPIITMLAGLGSGYLIWAPKSAEMEAMHPTAIREQVNPQNGYPIRAKYRNVGPRLVAAGVIDEAQFIRLYQQAGKPLTPDQ